MLTTAFRFCFHRDRGYFRLSLVSGEELVGGVVRIGGVAAAEAAKEYGLGYDLVAGGNIAGFKKVATAMMEQGLF